MHQIAYPKQRMSFVVLFVTLATAEKQLSAEKHYDFPEKFESFSLNLLVNLKG